MNTIKFLFIFMFLTINSLSALAPKIATGANGQTVVAAWADGQYVKAIKSTDAGVTWPSSAAALSIGDAGSGNTALEFQLTASPNTQYFYGVFVTSDGRIDVARYDGKTAIQMEIYSNSPTDNGSNPQLATVGQYVYVTFQTDSGKIMFAQSTNAGLNWTLIEISTPSTIGQDVQLAIDITGQHVRAIWPSMAVAGYSITYESHSNNYGAAFSSPQIIYNLSALNDPPDIATDGDGSAVYVTCTSGDLVYLMHSTDGGNTWSSPKEVYEKSGTSSRGAQVATDSSGRYAYLLFINDDVVKALTSQNSGATFSPPSSTPLSTSPSTDLSLPGASELQLKTNPTGKYVTAMWLRNGVVQVAVSNSNGLRYGNPPASPGGSSPDISDPSQPASDPRMAMAATGQTTFTWATLAGVMATNGQVFNISSSKSSDKFLFQIDKATQISWTQILPANYYRLYRNSLGELIYEGANLQFSDHGATYPTTYFLSWVDILGNESVPTSFVVK